VAQSHAKSMTNNLPLLSVLGLVFFTTCQCQNEYYTLKRNAQKQIQIVLKDKTKREVYCINLLRIAALRELVNGPIHEGALGYPGDDINIAYDPKFKPVFFL
jgi:hypothetical protein